MTTTPLEHQNEITPRRPAEVVREFLQAFFSGDTETARTYIGDDFSFRAPRIEGRGDQAAFFGGAEAKARYVRNLRILRQWEDGDDVSTVYELEVETPDGSASLLMHEWHLVNDGQITSSVMVFDTDAPAARLIAQALMGSQH